MKKIRAYMDAGLQKLLRDTPGYGRSWEATARETGWATNGKVAVLLSEQERRRYADAEGMPHTAKSVQQVIIDRDASPLPARIASVQENRHDGKPEYLVGDESGRMEIVDARYVETVRRRYPEASIHLSECRKFPTVIFRLNGQTVGVIVAITKGG